MICLIIRKMESKSRIFLSKSSLERSQRRDLPEKKCSYCHEVPRQIICLSCDHETCLACFWKGAEKGGEVPKSFKCGLCNRLTFLGREVRQLITSFLPAEAKKPATLNYSFLEYDLSDSGLSSPPSVSPDPQVDDFRCATHDLPFTLYDEGREAPLCAVCAAAAPKQRLKQWRQVREELLRRFQEDLRELELRRRLLRGQMSEGLLRRKAYEEAVGAEFKRLDGALKKAATAIERAREDFDALRAQLMPISPPREALSALEGQTRLLKQLKQLKVSNTLSDNALLQFGFAHSQELRELLAAPLGSQILSAREDTGQSVSAGVKLLLERVAQDLRVAATTLESPPAPPTQYKGKFSFSLEKAARQAGSVQRPPRAVRQSNSPLKQRAKNVLLSNIVRNTAGALPKSARKV